MRKTKPATAILSGTADDVEASFYEALQNANIDQLMACWSDDDEVVCVHPAGQRLVGVQAIRAAYEAMFATGGLHLRAEHIQRIDALSSAVHSVMESIDLVSDGQPLQICVIATNVYHKTAQGWRMVTHHASPGNVEEIQASAGSPVVLH